MTPGVATYAPLLPIGITGGRGSNGSGDFLYSLPLIKTHLNPTVLSVEDCHRVIYDGSIRVLN